MLPQYKTKTNVYIGIGILVQLIAMVGFLESGIGILLRLLGSGLFIAGCVFYVKGKGHHGGWGALGLLSIIGLIILICMKDKNK